MLKTIEKKIENNLFWTFLLLSLFYVFFASAIYGIANTKILNSLHNSNGFWFFSADSILYHQEAINSLKYLESFNLLSWWNVYSSHAHVRIISLIYWLTGISLPVVFQFINAIMWSSSVLLIFRTSQLLFKNTIVSFITILFFLQPSKCLQRFLQHEVCLQGRFEHRK